MDTKTAAPTLKLLASQTINQLRTGVSVTSVPQALVEVVSNSLDARSTAISVTLLLGEHGFRVEDDGVGVAASQLPLVGTRYSTSKQAGSRQLGYRGEALSSIAQVARLHITTRAVGSFETFERVIIGGAQLRHGPCAPLRFDHLSAARGTRVEVLQFMRCGSAAVGAHGGQLEGGRRAAGTIKAAQDRNIEQLQEACVHQVLQTVLPHTSVHVQIWSPHGKLLLDMPKGRSLPIWAARILRPAGLHQQPSADGLRWMEEVEDHVAAAGSSAPDLNCRYRISGMVLGADSFRPAPDSQLVYINKRRINLPAELQEMTNSWFRAAVSKAAAAAPPTHASGSAAAAAGSARLGTQGPCFPAYVLVIECPASDVVVDGELDKSSVTISRMQAVKTLLARILHRAWGASGAGVSGAKDCIAPPAAAAQPQAGIQAVLDKRSGGTKRKLDLPAADTGRASGAQTEQRWSGRAVAALQPSLQHPNSRTRSLASAHPAAATATVKPASLPVAATEEPAKQRSGSAARTVGQAAKQAARRDGLSMPPSEQHPIVEGGKQEAPMFVRNPGMMQNTALRPMMRWLHNANTVPGPPSAEPAGCGHGTTNQAMASKACGLKTAAHQQQLLSDDDEPDWSLGTPADLKAVQHQPSCHRSSQVQQDARWRPSQPQHAPAPAPTQMLHCRFQGQPWDQADSPNSPQMQHVPSALGQPLQGSMPPKMQPLLPSPSPIRLRSHRMSAAAADHAADATHMSQVQLPVEHMTYGTMEAGNDMQLPYRAGSRVPMFQQQDMSVDKDDLMPDQQRTERFYNQADNSPSMGAGHDGMADQGLEAHLFSDARQMDSMMLSRQPFVNTATGAPDAVARWQHSQQLFSTDDDMMLDEDTQQVNWWHAQAGGSRHLVQSVQPSADLFLQSSDIPAPMQKLEGWRQEQPALGCQQEQLQQMPGMQMDQFCAMGQQVVNPVCLPAHPGLAGRMGLPPVAASPMWTTQQPAMCVEAGNTFGRQRMPGSPVSPMLLQGDWSGIARPQPSQPHVRQRLSAPASFLRRQGSRLAGGALSDSDFSDEELPQAMHPSCLQRHHSTATDEWTPQVQHLCPFFQPPLQPLQQNLQAAALPLDDWTPLHQRLPHQRVHPSQPSQSLAGLQHSQPSHAWQPGGDNMGLNISQHVGQHFSHNQNSGSSGSLGAVDWQLPSNQPQAPAPHSNQSTPGYQAMVMPSGTAVTSEKATPVPQGMLATSGEATPAVFGIVPPQHTARSSTFVPQAHCQAQLAAQQKGGHAGLRKQGASAIVDLHATLVLIRAMPDAMRVYRRMRRAVSAPPGHGRRRATLVATAARTPAAHRGRASSRSHGVERCKSLGAVRLSGQAVGRAQASKADTAQPAKATGGGGRSMPAPSGACASNKVFSAPPSAATPAATQLQKEQPSAPSPPAASPVIVHIATAAAAQPPVQTVSAPPPPEAPAPSAPGEQPPATLPAAPKGTLVESVLRDWVNPVAAQRQALASRTVLTLEQLQQRGVVGLGGGGAGRDASGSHTLLVPSSVTRQDICGARMLTQVDRRFIIIVSASGRLLCVDQHAAHERIRLELLTTQLLQALGTPPPNTPSPPQLQPPTAAASGMQCARRGNAEFGGRDPPPLARMQHEGRSGSSADPPGVDLQLSSAELRAWFAHQHVVKQWGWDLQLPATDTAADCPAAGESSAAGLVPAPAASVSGGSAVLTSTPVVFGTNLTAADLKVFLHQLGDRQAGGVSVAAPGNQGSPSEDEARGRSGGRQHAVEGKGAHDPRKELRADQLPDSSLPSAAAAGGTNVLLPPGVLRVLRSRACRTAIMFGDALLASECEELMRLLATCDLWHSCAHGRPTVAPLVHLPALGTATAVRQQGQAGSSLLGSHLRSTPAGPGSSTAVATAAQQAKTSVSTGAVLTADRLRALLRKHRPCPK